MVRFTHPQMFYLFIPFVLFLLWNSVRSRKLNRQFSKLASDKIRKFLLNRVQLGRLSLKSTLILLGTAFVLLASTGPQIGTKLTPLKRKGVDVLIAVDTSTSMDAGDVKPSRMEKAKYEISRLINNLKGDRVGLIVFAGEAHLHCPLTEDYAAARLFLNTINTDIMETKGTNLTAPLELALEKMQEGSEGDSENKYKVIILVTDGEDHQGNVQDIARKAAKDGIVIHTIGVGTPGGGPIPIVDQAGNQTYKKDREGNIITTAMDGALLSEIANITGGTFIRVENQSNAITPLIDLISNMDKKEIKAQIFSQYEDRYQVFLILALLCFIIEFFITTRSKKEISWEGRFLQ
ncbi:MAG: VWA domain-containing protein [FCB group bacterium]|nr:VWA domain-containing protein [FCB group bacterium]